MIGVTVVPVQAFRPQEPA